VLRGLALISWIEGHEDEPVIGGPLSGVIAEAVGLRPGRAEVPDWLDPFTARVIGEWLPGTLRRC
jgi:hypothetical protein